MEQKSPFTHKTCPEQPSYAARTLFKGSFNHVPLTTETIYEEPPTWCQKLFPSGFKKELSGLGMLICSLTLANVTMFGIAPIALMFCGHLGKIALDSVALANSMITICGISVAGGLGTACDTMFAQIYGSAHREHLGVAFQRSLILLGLSSLPCLALHLCSEHILVICGQDPEVARGCSIYLLIFMPGLISFFIFTVISKYLTSQRACKQVIYFTGIANVVNIVCHLILVTWLEYGIIGSAISQMLAYVTMMLSGLSYVLWSGIYKETWQGWSLNCLTDWGTLASLALFGSLQVCVEWWAFEAGLLLSGTLGITELGAQTIMSNLEIIAFMIYGGLGVAVNIQVGHHLGAGNGSAAMTSGRVASTVVVIEAIILIIIVVCGRNYIPMIFTNVPDVIELSAQTIPFLAFAMFFDCQVSMLNAIIRGAGLQTFGALIITISFAIALPLGVVLMLLTPMSLSGFWLAIGIGLFLTECSFLIFLNVGLDWRVVAEKAMIRSKSVSGQGYQVKAVPANLKEELEQSGFSITSSLTLHGQSIPIQAQKEVDWSWSHSHQIDGEKQPLIGGKTDDNAMRNIIIKRIILVIFLFGTFVLGCIVKWIIPIPTYGEILVIDNSTIALSTKEYLHYPVTTVNFT